MFAQTITIPGTLRPTLRRSAKDVASGLTAYVIPRPDKAEPSLVSVSLKRGARLVGCTLAGHKASVVDMEFLTVPGAHTTQDAARAAARVPGSEAEMYVLGTCDKDGVVFLWFLEIERGADNVERALSVRRKYSFYSLRKSTDAHYARIRIAGTVEKGSMVLVPNDGSNVRIIGFSCDARPIEVDGKMSHDLRIAAAPREGLGRREGAEEGEAPGQGRPPTAPGQGRPPTAPEQGRPPMPGVVLGGGAAAAVAGVAAVAAAAGTEEANMGPTVESTPPSSKDRFDLESSGLGKTEEEVFGSDSSSDVREYEVDDYEADQLVDASSSSASSSVVEGSDQDTVEEAEIEYGVGRMGSNSGGEMSDVDVSSIAESADFKDAQGAPLQHMAS